MGALINPNRDGGNAQRNAQSTPEKKLYSMSVKLLIRSLLLTIRTFSLLSSRAMCLRAQFESGDFKMRNRVTRNLSKPPVILYKY